MLGVKQHNLNFTMYKNCPYGCCFSSSRFFPANQHMSNFVNKWEFNRQGVRVRATYVTKAHPE